MHVDNATTPAPRAARPRPRARMSRLGRACASLVVAVVAVATVGFLTPALAANVNGGTLTLNGTAKTVSTTSAGSIRLRHLHGHGWPASPAADLGQHLPRHRTRQSDCSARPRRFSTAGPATASSTP